MAKPGEWKRRLLRLGYQEIERAERRIPSGFIARQASDPAATPAIIHDISASGLYLITSGRWPIGKVLPLIIQVEAGVLSTVPVMGILQNADAPELDIQEPELPIQARVIRHDENGVGFSFVLPPGLDPHLWEVLVRNAVALTDRKTVYFTLRMLRTVLFLCRLCHAQAEEAVLLLGGELDETRTETAFDIAIGADKLLAQEPNAEKMRADPKLVASALKFGSWVFDDLTKHLWMGLLASSCAANAVDNSNQVLVDLLVNITPTQSHILLASCNKARELMSATDDHPSARVIFTPEEMMQLTNRTDLSRIATDIAYLFHAELLEKNFDFTSYLPTENFDITPARLGIELYKKCKGHLVNPQAPGASAFVPH